MSVVDPGRPPVEMMRRKLITRGWVLIAIGILIPFLALWGATIGWQLRQSGVTRAGGILFAVGSVVFAGRMLLWMAG